MKFALYLDCDCPTPAVGAQLCFILFEDIGIYIIFLIIIIISSSNIIISIIVVLVIIIFIMFALL